MWAFTTFADDILFVRSFWSHVKLFCTFSFAVFLWLRIVITLNSVCSMSCFLVEKKQKYCVFSVKMIYDHFSMVFAVFSDVCRKWDGLTVAHFLLSCSFLGSSCSVFHRSKLRSCRFYHSLKDIFKAYRLLITRFFHSCHGALSLAWLTGTRALKLSSLKGGERSSSAASSAREDQVA